MRKIALLLVLITSGIRPICAGENGDNILLGVWSGGGTASRAIYGTLVISKKQISWQGETPSSSCRTTYTVVERGTSDRYPNMNGEPTPGRTYRTFKLRLGPPECTENHGSFLFAFPSNAEGYVEVVTYDKNGRATGVVDFIKHALRPGDIKK